MEGGSGGGRMAVERRGGSGGGRERVPAAQSGLVQFGFVTQVAAAATTERQLTAPPPPLPPPPPPPLRRIERGSSVRVGPPSVGGPVVCCARNGSARDSGDVFVSVCECWS